MELYKIQLLESVAVLAVYAVVHYLTKSFVNRSLKQIQLQRGRRKAVVKAVHLMTFVSAVFMLAVVWGVKQSEIAVFVGTTLTVLGIAFFAQWSLLSNFTSSVLLLFAHPIKIGDTLRILDKDFPVDGEVSDLTYLFVHLKSLDGGHVIIVPNSLILQKSVLIMDRNARELIEREAQRPSG